MKNFCAALAAAGSLFLSACMYEAPVYVISCVGIGPLPLSDKVLKEMNRQELQQYLRIKQFWKENCKNQNTISNVAKLK